MEPTFREYLKNRYKPNGRGYDGETFAHLVGDYYSHKGMEWTADDERAIREYGYDPQNYLSFTDEQLTRLDEVQDAVIELCKKSWMICILRRSGVRLRSPCPNSCITMASLFTSRLM